MSRRTKDKSYPEGLGHLKLSIRPLAKPSLKAEEDWDLIDACKYFVAYTSSALSRFNFGNIPGTRGNTKIFQNSHQVKDESQQRGTVDAEINISTLLRTEGYQRFPL